MGTRTFGKGTVQEFFGERLDPEGSGLQLTVAAYLTPSGQDLTLQGGLEPDQPCKAAPGPPGAPPEACLARALAAVAAGGG